VVCRRTRAGVDEVLVQWECSWIAEDEVAQGEVVRTLLRRTAGGKTEMLVQWACTWEPVEQVDAAAVEDYCGVVILEDVVAPTTVGGGQAVDVRKPRIKSPVKRKCS
jgi:hypothetical protein